MTQHAQSLEAERRAPAGADAGRLSALVRLYPALAVPAYRLLWLASFPSTMAWQLSVVATGYAAITLSGSATVLGIVTSLSGLPMLVLSPLGGVVADRFPRRTVLFFSQGLLGGGAATVALLSALGLLEVWHLGALGFVQGIAFSFNMPARQSLSMEVVGPRLARSAAALNTSAPNFSRVAGPSLAGILLALPGVGVSGVFLTMTLMYGAVIVTLFKVPPSQAPAREGGLRAVWDSLLEGFRYILGSPVHRGLLGTAFVLLVLGAPVLQIMPVFSERVFAVGPTGLGLLLSANGVGALVGSIAVAALASHPRVGLIQQGLGIAFGLSIVGFALAPTLPIAAMLVGLFGASQASYMALNGTILMGNTEPRLYGRVLSVYLMTFAVTPIAALPLAWATDLLDPRLATGIAGGLVTLAVGVLAALMPAARRAR